MRKTDFDDQRCVPGYLTSFLLEESRERTIERLYRSARKTMRYLLIHRNRIKLQVTLFSSRVTFGLRYVACVKLKDSILHCLVCENCFQHVLCLVSSTTDSLPLFEKLLLLGLEDEASDYSSGCGQLTDV